MTVEQMMERVGMLNFEDRQKILDGISLEAALILKKTFPEWWFIQTLVDYKQSQQ